MMHFLLAILPLSIIIVYAFCVHTASKLETDLLRGAKRTLGRRRRFKCVSLTPQTRAEINADEVLEQMEHCEAKNQTQR